jgi:hypothetical protein
MKFLYALSFCFFLCASAFSQDDIDTDRPDQTETTSIVPVNRFQMENGFLHQQTNKNDSELLLPTSLWKFGISKNIELRLITELVCNTYSDSTVTGLNPIVVGIKVKLWEEKGILPQASLITHMLLPKVASKDLQVKHLAPEIRFLFQNTLSDDIDLGYNLGMNWDGESSDPIFAYTLSPAMNLTKQLKAYIEAFGFCPQYRHAEHWFDGGFMFLIGKDVQLDISAGYEVTSHEGYHQFYESVGFSFRI